MIIKKLELDTAWDEASLPTPIRAGIQPVRCPSCGNQVCRGLHTDTMGVSLWPRYTCHHCVGANGEDRTWRVA